MSQPKFVQGQWFGKNLKPSTYDKDKVHEKSRPPEGWKRPPFGYRYRDPTCMCWSFADANPNKLPQWCLCTPASELLDGCWCIWKSYPD